MAGLRCAFIESILGNLDSQLSKEFQLGTGLDEEFDKLMMTLRAIQCVLCDERHEEWNWSLGNVWLDFYDVDDNVDKCATLLSMDQTQLKQQVRYFSSPFRGFGQAKHHRAMAFKIKQVRKLIEEILKLLSRIRLQQGDAHGKRPTFAALPTSSFLAEPELHGREADKSSIIQRLLGSIEPSGRSLPCVIPILGMASIGKTALAASVFQDEKVAQHFDLRIWSHVSYDFDLERLIGNILYEVGGSPDCLCIAASASLVVEKLRGKRYLLVLDDVWNEDFERWGQLLSVIRHGAEGSKVIVTTRSEVALKIMGGAKANTYYLQGLSDDDCWNIFESRAFVDRQNEGHPDLVEIGREIVSKHCDGMPLAAKALGGLMFRKMDKNFWSDVRDNIGAFGRLTEFPDCISSTQRVSYDCLSSQLKQCIAYCSVFPKGHEIKKETLVQLWAAQGFIQSANEFRSLEDVGNNYFCELLRRSFFRDVETDEYGDVSCCKMPNLVLDFVESINGDECSSLCLTKKIIVTEQTRHLSLSCNGSEATFPMAILRASGLRTLLFIQPIKISDSDLCRALLSLKRLRALTISQIYVTELPSAICTLIHLRYLDIEYTSVKKLPEDIINLRNLQTLKLGSLFKELPQDMSSFQKLMFLEFESSHGLMKMPANIGKLKLLRRLSKFIVGSSSGCGIGELHTLDLCGNIVIENLENVTDIRGAEGANLKGKHRLRELELVWSHGSDRVKIESVKDVLEGLQPHPNLQRLSIKNYGGIQLPKWLMPSLLQKITHVTLDGFVRCEVLPPFGDLPLCESLELRKMYIVKFIDSKCHNDTDKVFPSLKRLILYDMRSLEKFFISMNKMYDMPHLEVLIIGRCPQLTSLPSLSSLSNLTLMNSNQGILSSVAGLRSLKKLRIDGFPEVESLPQGMLQSHDSLEMLEINDCPKLRSLSIELKNLSFLRSLRISVCHNLTSLSFIVTKGVASLQELSIRGCDNLTFLPAGMQYLTSLKELSIVGLPRLTTLPEDVRHLVCLEELTIGGCSKFTFLPEWLGELKQLRVLNVRNLSRITSLPSSLDNISSLKVRKIRNCPHLEK